MLMIRTAQVPRMPFNHQTNQLRKNGAPDSFGRFDLVEDHHGMPQHRAGGVASKGQVLIQHQ